MRLADKDGWGWESLKILANFAVIAAGAACGWQNMKQFFWNLLRALRLGGVAAILLDGELRRNGWFLSFDLRRSVDAQGRPIPWFTYPALDFLEPRLTPRLSVFEFGAGSSTQWFAPRVAAVTSVENHKGWFEEVKKTAPANVTLFFDDQNYPQAVLREGKPYDLILIDGILRNECALHSLNALTERGVVIFDNSDRDEYSPAFRAFEQAGFRRVDFWGMTPSITPKSCTTFFYRENNCLGL